MKVLRNRTTDFEALASAAKPLGKEEMKSYVGGMGVGLMDLNNGPDTNCRDMKFPLGEDGRFDPGSRFNQLDEVTVIGHRIDPFAKPGINHFLDNITNYVNTNFTSMAGLSPDNGFGGGGTYMPNMSLFSDKNGIHTLLSKNFRGYKNSDAQGCLRRCKEMLASVGVYITGEHIFVTQMMKDGTAGAVTANASHGFDILNKSLELGKPVVVGVDYKPGTANPGSATDHFIVIEGYDMVKNSQGQLEKHYHFYDPATGNLNAGTSKNNILIEKGGKLIGSFTTLKGEVHKYTVTDIRPNK